MLHSKVEPGSLEEKSKVAFGELLGSGCDESMLVSGSVASKSNVREEAASVLPASSRARTRTV